MNPSDTHVATPAPGTSVSPATAKTQHMRSETAHAEFDPRSVPVLHAVTNIDIDVTENCNLGCVYCFKGDKYTKNMNLTTMKQTLEWLIAASGNAERVNCNFMGGEPTMKWKDIKEFVPWARAHGKARGKYVSFSMTSNLTLWTQEIRDFVDEYGFGVLMSIDGCPEVQDAQRPAKNGQKMSSVVEYWAKSMLKTRPQSTARATVHPRWVSRLFESIDYLHSLGFREIAVANAEYGEWTPQHFAILREQMDQILRYIVDEYSAGRPVGMTVLRYYINNLIRHRRVDEETKIKFHPSPCGAGKGYMMVDYVGDIWPCHRFDGADEAAKADGAFRLGNIFQSGFNHSLQKAFLDFDHGVDHKERCTTCPANSVCGGFCPAANLSETGSMYTPHDAFCDWTAEMYRSADKLYDMFADLGSEHLEALLAMCEDARSDGQR